MLGIFIISSIVRSSDNGRVLVNPNALSVRIEDVEARLPEVGYKVFIRLLASADRWVRSNDLATAWDTTFQRGASNLRWHIKELRHALGPVEHNVHSDVKLGYMFSLSRCGEKHCGAIARTTGRM